MTPIWTSKSSISDIRSMEAFQRTHPFVRSERNGRSATTACFRLFLLRFSLLCLSFSRAGPLALRSFSFAFCFLLFAFPLHSHAFPSLFVCAALASFHLRPAFSWVFPWSFSLACCCLFHNFSRILRLLFSCFCFGFLCL